MKNFEQLRISVYYKTEQDQSNPDFTVGSEWHYKTHKILLKYSDILAIASKGASMDGIYTKLERGGALVYVKGRKEPYVTRDDESVTNIYAKLNRNPFCCYSGLNQVGSSKLYAKEYTYIDKNIIAIHIDDETKVPLHITKEAHRKLKWVSKAMKGKAQKTCFFDTKKRSRKKY